MKIAGRQSIRRSRTRRYRQDVRAEQARANVRSILDSAVKQLRATRRVVDVTLEQIAADAGVTVRTILRQYGSKDGIVEAAFAEIGRQIETARPKTEPGDIDAALAALLKQYELEGDLNARVVSEEDEIPILHKLLQHARKSHREWLMQVFGPHLVNLPVPEREERITALYAATEVQLWKVLRRDLHQSAETTARIFHRLVRGALST